MRNALLATSLLVSALGSSACSDDASGEPSRVGSTQGGAVALSRDERIAVVAQRSAGVVAVLRLDPRKPLDQLIQRSAAQIDLGAGSEPWAAVIGADGDTAYVVSRRDQVVHRIVNLRGAPRLDGWVPVGAEPTAISITPSGARLFVANWAEGTISVITTAPFLARSKVDLNAPLVGTDVLGPVLSRPGLAHPRALAMTDDGDADDDETLYATEFFSQPVPGAEDPEDLTSYDRNRQGFVYRMSVATGQVGTPIAIAPVLDTGFADPRFAALEPEEQRPTSCVPNQLYAAAVGGDRLYVTSLCTSPSGPIGEQNFKTALHPAIFTIDTATDSERPELGVVLTRILDELYALDGAAAGGRMPLIPGDLVVPDARARPARAYLTALGADAAFALGFDAQGRPVEVGRAGRRYVDLHGTELDPGRLPIGVALSRGAGGFALVANDSTHNVSVIDVSSGTVVQVQSTTDQLPAVAATQFTPVNRGRELFVTGLRVWSSAGQAWSSCESCHPDGLSDGTTWFFARGPRRTLSTAGTYDAERRRRIMLWTGNVDEIHDVEGIVRTVSGGAGAVAWAYSGDRPDPGLRLSYDGTPVTPAPESFGPKPTSHLLQNLNGSLAAIVGQGNACRSSDAVCDVSAVTDWNDIDAYVQSVRAPRRSTEFTPEEVAAGAAVFREALCAGCHGGPSWTVSRLFYEPGGVNNGVLPYERPASVSAEELGRLRTVTYSVPVTIRALNPPALAGSAPLRRWDPPADREAVVHLYGDEQLDGYDRRRTHADDQINCVLRDVGTFPDQSAGENKLGVAAAGAPLVWEVRQDMTTLALGATGFSPPPLLGLAVGAPYFHAGNARTLEELLDTTFVRHRVALNPRFEIERDSRRMYELVAFLASIDDDMPPPPLPSPETGDLAFEVDLCKLIGAAAPIE